MTLKHTCGVKLSHIFGLSLLFAVFSVKFYDFYTTIMLEQKYGRGNFTKLAPTLISLNFRYYYQRGAWLYITKDICDNPKLSTRV